MKIVRNSCPICKSIFINNKKKINNININYCSECLIYFSREILSNFEYKNYYKNEFASIRHLKGQKVNALINAKLIKKFVKNIKNLSVLDYGTGYGFLPKKLSKMGINNIEGYEISVQESNYAIDENNIKIISDDDLYNLEKKYQLITSFEVIEHIDDVNQFMHLLSNKLCKDGMLLIMTDNFFSNIVRLMGNKFPKWIPHTHITHFGPNSLIKLIEMNGFRIVKFGSYTPWELWIKFFLQSVGLKRFEIENNCSENEFNKKTKLSFIKYILSPLYASLTFKSNLNGQLIYILAQKN